MNTNTSGDHAAIAAIVSGDLCLLIRQPDRPDPKWKFSGGRRENGESVEETLVREVEEETGFKIPFEKNEDGRITLGDENVRVELLRSRTVGWGDRQHEQHFYLVASKEPLDLIALDRQVRKEDYTETIETCVFRTSVLFTQVELLPPQLPLLEELAKHFEKAA